ncbi:hypothetical protein [Pseudomonas brassicacearum]|uniref:DUF1330 domain-containing protein n=1 Tax=Pseudomonas brassicacearum TaxID=930166 RepID=A0A423JXD8_9PSED|nr:hypothetical protein [Pseudomonas brassicacearum]RON42366.1 hypothetical protein BK664_01940 [Pseudomonas brassicacearum]
MYLFEIFLPLTLNDGTKQPVELFARVREELLKRFGGVTAFIRSPAKGVWQQEENERAEDEIVIYEVMSESVDQLWWQTYKRALEQRFQQQELLIRTSRVDLVG